MGDFLSWIVILTFLFHLVDPTSSLTINNKEIRDLESTTSSLAAEASFWSVQGNFTSTVTSQCSGTYILGGYQITGNSGQFTRTYTSLPSHNLIYFSVFMWLIDTQESADLFKIYFDGTLVRDWNSLGYSFTAYPGPNLCGGSLADYTNVLVEGKVAHSASSLTFKLASMFNSASNSFQVGFRNLNLLFQTTTSTPSTAACAFTSTGDSSVSSCLCASNQYDPVGSGGCSSCNSACKTCSGGANTDCTSCPSGYSYNGQTCIACDSSCAQCDGTTSTDCIRCVSTQYLYWNGTCQSSCATPLVTTTDGPYQSCSLPCPLGQYYYQNGTCSTTCPPPFTQSSQGDLKYCNFPCSSSNYYYSNGSCLTCASPFTSITRGVERYCQSPCSSSSLFYFANNGTCGSSCNSPFTSTTSGVLKSCNSPCTSSQYLYWNNTCQTTCSSPLVGTTAGSYLFCNLPCTLGKYYYQNGTCSTTCPSPFTQSSQGDLKYCNFPCSSSNYYYSNGSCLSCSSPFTSVTTGIEKYCQSPCPSSSTPYYYQNSSCLSSCASPFVQVIQGVFTYCNFPCSSSNYLYSNGSCLTCSSPFTSVTKGAERYCQSPCPSSSTPYYYQNSTCLSSCASPFVQVAKGILTYCNFPCSSSNYLYSNGSCLTCSSPFTSVTKGTEKYCQSPCSSSSLYYFANNGTCGTNCDLPFTSSTSGILQSCNSPCTSSQYLYWNGTCQTTCLSPLVTTSLGSNQFCNLPCSLGGYYYQNNTCQTACASPFTQSNQGDLKYCNFPCSSLNYYYSNGSCLSCSSPFISVSTGIEKYCQSPCSSQYYYPKNNTCSSTCNIPYIQYKEGVLSYCVSPCLSSEYLYWNGSCSSYCPTSFQQVRDGDNYCKLYCEIPNYLDSANQVCKSSCPAPLVSSADAQSYKSCKLPCNSGEYFFPNGSCISKCPYQKRVGPDGVSYCDYPCSSSKYQYQNNSCLATCNAPYSVYVVDSYFSQCYSPCLSGQYYVEKSGSCTSSCNAPSTKVTSGVLKICRPSTSAQSDSSEATDQTSLGGLVDGILSGVSVAGSLIRPNDQHSAFVVALAKLIKYVQYIDVPMLESVRDSLSSGTSSGFTITQMFSFNMPEGLQSKFPLRNLPGLLGHGGLHSSYLVNHWTTLTTYIFLSCLGFFFFLIDKMIQKTSKKTLKLVSRRLMILMKWNFFLFAFFNTYDDLTYFAILELRTLHFSSAAEILSFIACILTSLYAIYILAKVFILCRGAMNVKKQVMHINGITPEKHFYNKHESYQVLYSGLRDDNLLAKNYLLIFTMRIILCYLIVAFLYEHPLIQSVQLTFMSLLMFTYLIKYRPIKDTYNVVVSWTYEILLLFANICLIILGIYSATGKMTADLQYVVSRCILISNNLINMCSSIFSYGYLITGAWYAFKTSKAFGEDGKTAWLIVPSSPYSNPGMDFDDLSYEFVETPEKKLIDSKNMSRMRKRISKNAQGHRFAPPKLSSPETSHETKLVSESSNANVLLFRRGSNNSEITSMNSVNPIDMEMEKRRSSLSILSSPSNRPLRISDQLGISTPMSESSSQDYTNLNIHSPMVIGKRSKKVQGFEEVLSDYLNKNAGLIPEENTLEDMATERNQKGWNRQSDLENSRFADSFNRIPSYIQNPTQRNRSHTRLLISSHKDLLGASSGRGETDFGISLESQSSFPKKEKRRNIRRSRILPESELINERPQNTLLSIFNPRKNPRLDAQVYEDSSLNITRENNVVRIQAKKNKIYDRLKAKGVVFNNNGNEIQQYNL